MPTREVTPSGMGIKLTELDDINHSRREVNEMRREWARTLEQGFNEYQNKEVEFDHRS
jgi:hypothetical protein